MGVSQGSTASDSAGSGGSRTDMSWPSVMSSNLHISRGHRKLPFAGDAKGGEITTSRQIPGPHFGTILLLLVPRETMYGFR